jgi:glutamine synthetase
LLNLKTVPEAVSLYASQKNIDLFKRQGIYTEEEVKARETILLEEYCKTIKIESLTMLDMLNRQILPAIFEYEKHLSQTIIDKQILKMDKTIEFNVLKRITNLLKELSKGKDNLLKALVEVRDITN